MEFQMNDTTNSGSQIKTADRQSAIKSDNILDGLLFDTAGVPMPHKQTRRNGRIDRHYVSKSKAAAGDARQVQERAPAWEIEAAVVRLIKAELIRQQAIVIAAGLLFKLHSEQLTQNDRDAKYVHGRLVEAWDLLFPCERIRIVKLLLERIDLTVDGFVVKWRDLPSSEFINECNKFGIFDQRSNHQHPKPDPDLVIQSPILWVPLPPGLRTWRSAKPD
jgi:hypothetical protein